MKIYLKLFAPVLMSILFFLSDAQAQIIAPPIGKGDSTYTNVDVDASFPGGPQAWTKYITQQILQSADQFRKKDYGTCMVRFIVGSDGYVHDVEAMTMKKSRLAKIAIDAIENGPRWVPAQQNGKNVNAYRIQPVTVTEPDK